MSTLKNVAFQKVIIYNTLFIYKAKCRSPAYSGPVLPSPF